MGFHLRHIEFRDFRNYHQFTLDDLGPLTILVGQNAVGKTNIIEGIQLLTSVNTFRHAPVGQLIRQGCEEGHLMADIEDGNRNLRIQLDLLSQGKRCRINGKPKRSNDVRILFPSVVFTPDDLELVKGSMGVRRRAIDTTGSQLTANYSVIRKDYEKVIQHKNRLLKEEASPSLIDSIDELLITCGAQLVGYRTALFQRICYEMEELYQQISQGSESFGAHYYPSWELLDIKDDSFQRKAVSAMVASSTGEEPLPKAIGKEEARVALEEALRRMRPEELRRHQSLVGPHGDALVFTINDMDSSDFASQGQQRSVVLCYKLAEAQIIEDMLGTKPLLLLDDVMSELDGVRRDALVNYITQDVQTFITTANLSYFDDTMLNRAEVIALPRKAGDA